jgi:hypothetical protein
MLVWTQTDNTLWRLTDLDGIWEIAYFQAYRVEDTASPITLHTFDTFSTGPRATIFYDLTVMAIGPYGGRYAAFKIAAVFERDGSTVTERDITFLNGPVTSNPAWDVAFDVTGTDINIQVVGELNGVGGVYWRAEGCISVVGGNFLGGA